VTCLKRNPLVEDSLLVHAMKYKFGCEVLMYLDKVWALASVVRSSVRKTREVCSCTTSVPKMCLGQMRAKTCIRIVQVEIENRGVLAAH